MCIGASGGTLPEKGPPQAHAIQNDGIPPNPIVVGNWKIDKKDATLKFWGLNVILVLFLYFL